MEPKASLLHSQEFATGPYPDLDDLQYTSFQSISLKSILMLFHYLCVGHTSDHFSL